MIASLRSPARACAAALAVSLLALATAAERAAAYDKPPGGTWTFQNLFERTRSGALALTRDGSKIARLVLVPGEDYVTACGSAAIRLVARPQVRSYASANGRYAVAGKRNGLFVPKAMTFKQGRRTFTPKLMLLWGETGRLVETGKLEFGDCRLSFYASRR